MVATHIKKIKHSTLCVTGVYLRDLTNIIFVILHLNVSHLSVCSSCLFRIDGKDSLHATAVFVVVAYSLHAGIMGEGSANHFQPAFFSSFF